MEQTLSATAAAPLRDRTQSRSRRTNRRSGSRWVRAALVLGVVGVLGMWWFSVPAGFAATPADALTSVGELSGMVGGSSTWIFGSAGMRGSH